MRWLLQFAAGFVIVMALLVGVARLLLPEASSLTDDIKTGVSDATGFTIDFDGISAGISFYGPELRLRGVNLSWADGAEIAVADRLSVSLDVIDSIAEQRLVPERVRVEGTIIDAEITAEGELKLQGRPWRDLLPGTESAEVPELPDASLQLANIQFAFRDLQRELPEIRGLVSYLDLSLDDAVVSLIADVLPGEELGQGLELDAQFPYDLLVAPDTMPGDTPWDLSIYARNFRLDTWLRLADLTGLPVIDSEGSAEVRLGFSGKNVIAIQTELDLENVGLVQPGGGAVVIEWFEGKLGWRRTSSGWLATGEALSLGRDRRVWPESSFSVRYSEGPDEYRSQYVTSVSFARIDDLVPVLRALDAEALAEAGLQGELSGDVSGLSASLNFYGDGLESFTLDTDFGSLGYVSPAEGLEFSGYTGSVNASEESGELILATIGASFGIDRVFRETLEIESLNATLDWRAVADGYRINSNKVEVQTPHGAAVASLSLSLDEDFGTPRIDISGDASLDDISEVPGYLPTILPSQVVDWLDDSLISGAIPFASFVLKGPLQKFPFDGGEGEFRADVNFVEATLDYAPDWPMVTQARGQIVFDRASLYSRRNNFFIAGIPLKQIDLGLADMRAAVLTASGRAEADLTDVLALLRATPVKDALGPVFDDVIAEGPAQAALKLQLPILDLENWQFNADFAVTDVRAALDGIEPAFTSLRGRGRIDNVLITMPEATAVLLDEPVEISVRPATEDEPTLSHVAVVTGKMQVPLVWQAFGMPATGLLSGMVPVTAQALFPATSEETADLPAGSDVFRLLLSSDLLGAGSGFPYPLDKEPEAQYPASAELLFPEDGMIDFSGTVRGINWNLALLRRDDDWSIDRGEVNFGGQRPAIPDTPGLLVTGYIDSVAMQDWYDTFTPENFPGGEGDSEFEGWQQTFSRVSLRLDEIYEVNHRFIDVEVDARPLEAHWDINLTGPWAEGNVRVPFDFAGDDELELAMDRLLLLEPLEGAERTERDPRDFPTAIGTIADFSIGAMRFGSLSLELERVPGGLRSVRLSTRSDSFFTESSADWVVIDNAQRTRLHLELESTDFEATLRSLDYSPAMTGSSATVIADLLWEGYPGEAMIYESTGSVELSVREGIVREVEPGGGRILGLASVSALPRRMSLDFSEITERGLVFDRIDGTFRIDFGNAWTCDLGLEGDIADMGIIGRVGILEEDYDQIAVVRPHVSNLAPVAGAFLAGPAVGAATLLITQIFKKPLSGMGGSYFTITGDWDDPQLEEADAGNLDLNQFSECEAELPNLSPEEIQAIQDLMQKEQPAEITDPPPPDPVTLPQMGPIPE
jgi:uncharacterized protein (TIGR02099 family)